jgi:hypothetical protein
MRECRVVLGRALICIVDFSAQRARMVLMQRDDSLDAHRERRWDEFRRRADFAPHTVYRHRVHGWEYLPVHPFADEAELLGRLGMRPEDCVSVDAWWGIDEDATLVEATVVGRSSRPAGLFAKATDEEDQRVYLLAVFDAPFVTRAAFEGAMTQFVEAGFPRDPRFRLRWGDPWLQISGGASGV